MTPHIQAHPITFVLFEDTVCARMLRMLAEKGEMPQADFMREYHRRCERARPSRSAFLNNFGRYTGAPRSGHGSPLPVITQVRLPSKYPSAEMRARNATHWSGRNLLRWHGPTIVEIVQQIPDAKLETYFARMKHAMLAPPRATDTADDFTPWALRLSREIARRCAGGAIRTLDVRPIPADKLPGPFVVRFDGRVMYSVQSLTEASLRWARVRDESGRGASTSPAVTMTNPNAPGRAWRVSYNARIWEITDETDLSGGNLVYDPSTSAREARDEARGEAWVS
jgi:hypothetical protein